MRISSDGCEPCKFDTQPAVTHWLKSSARCRRPAHNPYKPRKKKTDGVAVVPEVPLDNVLDSEPSEVIGTLADSDSESDRDFEGFHFELSSDENHTDQSSDWSVWFSSLESLTMID